MILFLVSFLNTRYWSGLHRLNVHGSDILSDHIFETETHISGTFLRIMLGVCNITEKYILTLTPWSESASELYRPSDRRLSAKRLPTCVDRGCHVVSVTDPSGRILSVF
jgi:hypothetical protein